MNRPRVAAAARGWIGTPWCHGASCRGAGSDCLGLLRGLWRELCGPEPEPVPAYPCDWAESGADMALHDALARNFLWREPAAEAVGDVLLFRLRAGGPAKHLAIQVACGAHPAFVHACAGHGVVEAALSAPWRRRLVARFAFPMN